jgi:hypothetical protein
MNLHVLELDVFGVLVVPVAVGVFAAGHVGLAVGRGSACVHTMGWLLVQLALS